jgi:hypothetical protein
MSIECGWCERDLRGGCAPDCPRSTELEKRRRKKMDLGSNVVSINSGHKWLKLPKYGVRRCDKCTLVEEVGCPDDGKRTYSRGGVVVAVIPDHGKRPLCR